MADAGQGAITQSIMTDIAEAIRAKRHNTVTMRPRDMAGGIADISTDPPDYVRGLLEGSDATLISYTAKKIMYRPFAYNAALKTLILHSVTSISDPYLMWNCGMEQLYLLAPSVVTCDGGSVALPTAFDSAVYDPTANPARIHVPADMVAAYKSHSQWSYYASIIIAEGTATGSVSTDTSTASGDQGAVTEQWITNIAEAIRTKIGSTTQYRPIDMAAAISNIPSVSGVDTAFEGLLDGSLTTINNANVTKISTLALQNNGGVKTLILPSCMRVEASACGGAALTSVNLPSCTYCGTASFDTCRSLQTVTMANGVAIDSSAFRNTVALTTWHGTIGSYKSDSFTGSAYHP